jgi:nicotinamidase/pyrazinamidase
LRPSCFLGFNQARKARISSGSRSAPGLADYLRERGVTEVSVMGLATDYCVRFTTLDAVHLGFTTKLVLDGRRGVEVAAGDCQRAIAEMRDQGVVIQ